MGGAVGLFNWGQESDLVSLQFHRLMVNMVSWNKNGCLDLRNETRKKLMQQYWRIVHLSRRLRLRFAKSGSRK